LDLNICQNRSDKEPCSLSAEAECGENGCSWQSLRNTGQINETANSATFLTHYAARYKAQVSSCSNTNCLCVGKDEKRSLIWEKPDGIPANSVWNASIAPVVLPNSTGMNVSVTKQYFNGSANNSKWYFPRLKVRLKCCADRQDCTNPSEIKMLDTRFGKVVNFDQSVIDKLDAGCYQVVVSPKSFNCQGASCPKKLKLAIPFQVPELEKTPTPTSKPRPTQHVWLFVFVGVLCGLIVSSSVIYCVYRSRRFAKLPEPSTDVSEMSSSDGADSVTALLVHRGVGAHQQLKDLKDHLGRHGVSVVDCQEKRMLHVLQSMHVWDVLELVQFRQAKLLFISASSAGPVKGNATPRQGIYDSILCQVRNAQLGQDYSRVFSVALDDAAGSELVGLAQGRLFRAQHDLHRLVEHLRAPASARRANATTTLNNGPTSAV